MSGTRFARSGLARCRLLVCFGTLMLLFGMVAIFHRSQQQLEDIREQRLHCEHQQEALNERLQSIVEQKFNLEKSQERDRNEQMEQKRSLDLKSKELNELQEVHKLLQSEYKSLVNESAWAKKQQHQSANSMEKQLHLVRAELEKQKNVQQSELAMCLSKELVWKEKANINVQLQVNASDTRDEFQKRIKALERIVAEYQINCDYKPQSEQQRINKPLNALHTTHVPSVKQNSQDKPHQRLKDEKSFSEQELVSAGVYRIGLKSTDTRSDTPNFFTNKFNTVGYPPADNNNLGVGATHALIEISKKPFSLPFSASNNISLILNSVENFQILPKTIRKLAEEQHPDENIAVVTTALAVASDNGDKIVSPLSAPRKPTSAHVNASIIVSATTSVPNIPVSSFSKNQRKLPEYVAPIPENFEDLLRSQKMSLHDKSAGNGVAVIAGKTDDDENDKGKNNRYANVVNDMIPKIQLAMGANEDSGAHEIKDRDFMNEPNLKLAHADDDTIRNDAVEQRPSSDEDIVDAAANIALKNRNHLLDADSLNNEIAGDQGKEFPEGLHLEDVNEEDEDEDDYSNLAARQQGAQAIRN